MADGAVYRRIADDLRQHIESGEYAPGSHLRAVPDLAYDYDVGQNTIKRALGLLERDGLIIRRAGLRAQVRPREEPRVLIAHRGAEIRSRPATPQERADRGIPEGVWVIQVVDEHGFGDVYPADQVIVRVE